MTFTPRAIFALVGTFGYLGLAILAWGGFAAFSSHSALTVLVLVTFLLSGPALFTRRNLSPGEREDRSRAREALATFPSHLDVPSLPSPSQCCH